MISYPDVYTLRTTNAMKGVRAHSRVFVTKGFDFLRRRVYRFYKTPNQTLM